MPLTLRRAEAGDAAQVRDLTRAAYAPWATMLGREPLPMRADYDRAVQEHRIDMAYDNDTLVGLIELVDEPEALLIENVAVRPDLQGGGIGTFLMRHAEAVARAIGTPVLRLYTNGAFAVNIVLYQRLGYAITREEQGPWGTVVHMRKPVPEQ
ncbi:MAG: GNAT family N-acetyltransferase [Acetobacteraceae bacterium]|nr:GNAT family N-acetyltransferase [Acetobacteraceae bacterium]